MDYLQYVIIALLLVAVILIVVKKKSSNALISKLMDILISTIKENEAWIVQGLYNSLPSTIKNKLSSKQVADIVSCAIEVIKNVLNDKAGK